MMYHSLEEIRQGKSQIADQSLVVGIAPINHWIATYVLRQLILSYAFGDFSFGPLQSSHAFWRVSRLSRSNQSPSVFI